MEHGLRKKKHFSFFSIEFSFNRTSTVILVRRDQTGVFIEKTLSNPLVNPLEWTVYTWNFKLNNANEPPVLIN